ncbi:Zinc finger HIT domain-containing protein 1 [Hypsizygus marmoreus]|uniref:Zinc finger HIT domain-containing protein 1 n=1 Tax=Hypsizygus marmoreus TaxID=39966 RepID=A0A369JUR8_HYPMA|nr:Zinc finger HIT domain-containing protein 1 [Hypsizygus marmoreus]
MPPKKTREHHARQAHTNLAVGLAPEVIAKRTKRHLDELERSNYAEPTLLAGEDDEEGGKSAKGRARQTISDKRNLNIAGSSPAAKKKKSTMSVRTALLYRKKLATLIDESNIASLPPSVPTYLTALTPPPAYPPRILCTVCGYWGAYKCRRCAMPYCDMKCEAVHNETRCERRVV